MKNSAKKCALIRIHPEDFKQNMGLKKYFGKKHRFIKDMDKEPFKRETINKVDEFALSSGKYPLLGMKPDENLIFGHTHRPFMNKTKKVANTGSWIDELPIKIIKTAILK